MRPEDITAVQGSWTELRRSTAAMRTGMAGRFEALTGSAAAATVRAQWMIDATESLVGLLAVPSALTERAQALGGSWPDPLTAPSFAVDGRAWIETARDVHPGWTPQVEAAWREGWRLLSEVLAAESLAPFQTAGADERGGS